ncbi:hypothetical protein [Paraburkholderia caribensis]|uniref:hypothetical protein n=1 Tax=Paraburkholderia caribensis TaxID=75105 RepID=UPI00078D3370|nr:hypothetical protein [Paraburkholderia caribensis]AMV42281.1 hypothetical protein ATN79_06260 [Paraburkholderia caribensis]
MKKTATTALLAASALMLGACSDEPSNLDKLNSSIQEANDAIQVAQNMCRGDDTQNKLCAQLAYAQARIDDAQGYANKLKH